MIFPYSHSADTSCALPMHVLQPTAETKMGTEHLIPHMGEYSLFVPFVGVFVCIVVLIVCVCKGRRGKASSDIESKVLSGEHFSCICQ